MLKEKLKVIVICILVFGLIAAGCDSYTVSGDLEDALEASGFVEAVEVTVSTEISGTVEEMYVKAGEHVEAGQSLMKLENDLLDAQLEQALAALEGAEANLVSVEAGIGFAQANLESAEAGAKLAAVQYELVLKQSNLSEVPLRENVWDREVPDGFELPSWYFRQEEVLRAINDEVFSALADLEIEMENLANVLDNVSNADFQDAEIRLLNARLTFQIAEELLEKEIEQNGREAIQDYVQSLYDTTEAELKSAQKAYDSLLSEEKTKDVLEARARVAVADERYNLTLENAYSQQTGEYSLEVLAADITLSQAEAFVKQAESSLEQINASHKVAAKNVEQAEANLKLVELQRQKLIVVAPSDGVILSSVVDEGELVQPGMTIVVIGQLDSLHITVYLAEEVYGKINLGDTASIRVDSFPDETFEGKVIRIADKAEFTPRNVQTTEDRKTTVYAIEISVDGAGSKLKPGMPADVSFSP